MALRPSYGAHQPWGRPVRSETLAQVPAPLSWPTRARSVEQPWGKGSIDYTVNFKDTAYRQVNVAGRLGFADLSIKTAVYGKMDSDFDIVHLIFCSHVTTFGDGSEFEHGLRDILDRSLAHNRSHEITGALMTDGGMFAHVIEGPSAAVEDLYAKIRRDRRHDRILLLQHTVVHVRLFDARPIAFLRVGSMGYARTLDARSTPIELRKASISILKAFRPILLK